MVTELFKSQSDRTDIHYLQLLENSLRDILGVEDTHVSTSRQEFLVSFNDQLTTSGNIQAALNHAGFNVEIVKAKARHGEQGVCCGSCGG